VESTSRDEVTVRRAPKYGTFILLGVIVGVIVTFIAVSVAPGKDETPFLQAFGYFVLYGIAIGALLGAVVAVVFDAVYRRRAGSVSAERLERATPESDEPVDGELE
jgi:MFS family permease